MRVFGLGLLAAMLMSAPTTADATRIIDGIAIELKQTPDIAVELDQDVALSALVSPAMQWSQFEIDSVKAEGLNSSLPFAYTAELAMKSNLIQSYNVTQNKQLGPPPVSLNLRPFVGVLILMAGLTMWVGLSLQRKY